ncbi:unnamed protein product, partial [Aureobasidium pullulans]
YTMFRAGLHITTSTPAYIYIINRRNNTKRFYISTRTVSKASEVSPDIDTSGASGAPEGFVE